MRFAHTHGVSPLQETEIFPTPAEFSPGKWEATQPLQILRRSRGIGCQNEFSKLQRITGSIVLGCERCCCGAERRERGQRCEARERGRSTRHVNKAGRAGRAGNQAEGSDWLKPLCHVDATSACSGRGRGPGVHVVTSSRAWQVLQPTPPPCPHSQDMLYML